jgi:hypothetical protein
MEIKPLLDPFQHLEAGTTVQNPFYILLNVCKFPTNLYKLEPYVRLCTTTTKETSTSRFHNGNESSSHALHSLPPL